MLPPGAPPGNPPSGNPLCGPPAPPANLAIIGIATPSNSFCFASNSSFEAFGFFSNHPKAESIAPLIFPLSSPDNFPARASSDSELLKE
uniref:Uncharacterized protein n=1 Tax=Arcella intermedia TaxID=1963864 RepID=A0A6B2LUU9_9EUKA